ncbi:ATP-binding protein [Arcicella sp. DC2W]|uniref:histidine kinase n=1 Tax=Arcicella gelida TaxID=2984195 RepID=A0ABU5S0I5_9BACT|nr:ATP-binding protein [Arcicella sp. DC2W]MEA5401942.1 ATP-binding protein [Arcicella sp. DC2W]
MKEFKIDIKTIFTKNTPHSKLIIQNSKALSLKAKYILFVTLIHAVIIFLTFRLLNENKLYFILSEILVLASIAIAIKLYQDFIQPLKFLLMGAEAIKDQDFSVKFRKVGKQEMDELIEVYNAMIDQLRNERLQAMEQHFFLEKLIQASPIAIVILDFDGNITKANPQAQALFSLPEYSSSTLSLSQIQHPIIPYLILLENREAKTIQLNGLSTYKIQRSFFMDRGFARPFLLIEELTNEIWATEKKAYGKVIRMMAHEVNNSIGAVNSILEVTKKFIEDDDLSNALKVATERNDRLNLFMRRFADIVRLPLPNKEIKSMSNVVKNVVELMRLQMEQKGISLQTAYQENTNQASFDVGQIEQVLVNILKNAIEACDGNTEKIIQVSVTNTQIIIGNNGKPIPEAIEKQLFTPFFSDKPEGQGIGLMLCREILNNHGFAFSLQTNKESITEFIIDFV